MRKRFDPMWRIAVALLLVISLAPLAVLAGVTQADTPVRPETYMDPIPEYINFDIANSATEYIRGTSLDSLESSPVVDIEVQVIRNSDGYRWNDATGLWVDNPDRWNSVLVYGTFGVETWTTDQWAWTYGGGAGGPAPADLDSAGSYTVKARAVDGLGFQDLSPAYRSFIYDNEEPDVSFATVFPGTVYDSTTTYSSSDFPDKITGTASDDDGEIDQVRLLIEDTDNTLYWNGHWWQANSVWIKAQGTTSWEISKTTDPPLPEWRNNVNYEVSAQTADKAGNKDSTFDGPEAFLFRREISSTTTTGSIVVDVLPEYANAMDVISGTAKAKSGQDVAEVRICIYDQTDKEWWNEVGNMWDGSTPPTSTSSAGWADCPVVTAPDAAPAPYLVDMPAYGQWDWAFDVTAFATDLSTQWANGHKYRIQVYMEDDAATPNKKVSSYEDFIYDDEEPGSSIDAFDVIVYNTWTSLTGHSGDSKGEVGQVVVLIQRSVDNLWWNGAGWGNAQWGCGADEWDWIFATPTNGKYDSNDEDWKVTTTTPQDLPPLRSNEAYHVEVHALDRAGNEETTAVKDFTYRVDLESYTPPAPPVTPGPTPEPTYSPGPEPTYSPGPAPTQSPGPQPTQSPGPQPTQSPGPQPSPGEPTPTPTPETSVTKTIGAGGGEICLEDNRVCVDFPSGAFGSSTEVTITLETVGGTICLNAPEGYSPGNTCFTISPSSELAAAADVCVEYTNYEYYNAADGDAGRLKLAYQAGGKWTVLKTTVDTSAGTACAQTKHLSSWVTAIEDEKEGMEWLWWYWVIIGVVALIVIVVIILLFVRPRRGGEEEDEGDYEEEL